MKLAVKLAPYIHEIYEKKSNQAFPLNVFFSNIMS